MYHSMEPTFRSMNINVHVTAYIFAILASGYLYDRIGRKITSIAGILLLALSFSAFPKLPVLSAYFIQSSYAFIDVFSMLIWADLSYFGSEARHYSVGISALVLSILSGYWFMSITELNPFDFCTNLTSPSSILGHCHCFCKRAHALA